MTENGVETSEEKVTTIRNTHPPRMPVTHDHSWVWLNLRHKNVEFKWQSEKQASFELKELVTSTSALANFNVNIKTWIVADASSVGLGVVLIQLQGDECRVIAYASRGLTNVERRYSQVERSPGVGLRTLSHVHFWKEF